MERKTNILAEPGRHDLFITREFELPVELLFRAHAEADIFEQWMSHEYGIVKMVKLEARKHGSWKFQTTDKEGNVLFAASGVFADFIPESRITRTFEMENTPFPIQLEFLEFENLGEERSKLTMQIVYRTVEYRDKMLKSPFAHGLNMAHDRLQLILQKK